MDATATEAVTYQPDEVMEARGWMYAATGVGLAAATLGCYTVLAFLPEILERFLIAGGIALLFLVFCSCLLAVGSYWPGTARLLGKTIIVGGMALVCLYFGSCWWKQVTFCRFGLTVLGGLPVPVLDIVVYDSGVLWFRPKVHEVSGEELERLGVAGVEEVIVGTGWSGAVHVDAPGVLRTGARVVVLRSLEAVDYFNRAVRAGRRVCLLLHSTC